MKKTEKSQKAIFDQTRDVKLKNGRFEIKRKIKMPELHVGSLMRKFTPKEK